MSARNPTGKTGQQSDNLREEEAADALGARFSQGARGHFDEEAVSQLRSDAALERDPTQTRHNVKMPEEFHGISNTVQLWSSIH